MYRADSLLTKAKRQRVPTVTSTTSTSSAASQHGSHADDEETEGIKIFLKEFTDDYPATAGLPTSPVLRTGAGFGDPKLRGELRKQFYDRGELLIAIAEQFVTVLQDQQQLPAAARISPLQLSANFRFPNLRFSVEENPNLQYILFEPGYFALPGSGWGVKPNIISVNPDVLALGQLLQTLTVKRSYHDENNNAPNVISGLMNSAWRDLQFLSAVAIDNIGRIKFNPNMTLMIPTEFDKEGLEKFPGRTPGKPKITYSTTTASEIERNIKTYIENGYNESFFPEDIPMFFERDTDVPQGYHKKYLLSCLDKATFLANYGTLYQSSLGYDKTQMTSANPFQIDAAALQEEKETARILQKFEEEMDTVAYLLAGWNKALVTHLVPAQAMLQELATPLEQMLQLQPDGHAKPQPAMLDRLVTSGGKEAVLSNFRNIEKNWDTIFKKVREDVIRDLVTPITESVTSLQQFQENAIARKKAEMRIKKLESDILKMKNSPGGGVGTGSTSSDAEQKAQRMYLEAAVRLQVYELLRKRYKLFGFADLVAGGTVASLQRLLRNDYDDLITKEVLRRIPADATQFADIGGVGGEFELAIMPFEKSFGTEMIFTQQLQYAVGKCFERVKLIVWTAMKAGRQGRTVIRLEDLTQGTQELVVAFASLVSLELAATQEVQRKVSSAHHDQVLLLANMQNADSLIRGLLIKLGWACFSSPYEEAGARTNRLVFS